MSASEQPKRGLTDSARRRLDDHEWLWHRYITKGRTTQSIARELNVHPTVVTQALAIAESRRVDADADRTPLGLLWLEECLAAGLTVEQMAAEAQTSTEEVRQHLAHWQFEGRLDAYPALFDHKWLAREYRDKGRTMEDIGRELGVRVVTVSKYLRRAGFAIVDTNQLRRDAAVTSWPDELRDTGWLNEQYTRKRRSVSDIAQTHDVTDGLVQRALDRAGISRRTGLSKWHRDDVRALLTDRDALAARLRRYRDARELADDLGVGATTVHRWMRRHGLLANRQRHPDAEYAPERREGDHSKLEDPTWLRTRYIDDGLPQAEIAALIGVPRSVVSAALRRHGITREKVRYPQLKDPEWLKAAADRCSTTGEIAEEIGCTTASVNQAFDNLSIPRPIPRSKKVRYPMLQDRAWLAAAAERLGSLSAIAREVGCTTANVSFAFDNADLPRPSYDTRPDGRPAQLDDPEWLLDAYVTTGRSQADIAVELGVGRSAVRAALHRQGISRSADDDASVAADEQVL